MVARERYRPDDSSTGRETRDGSAASPQRIVQVWGSGSVGDLLAASNGVHPGRIRTLKAGVWSSGLTVWLQFIDWETDSGAVIAEHGRKYVGIPGGMYRSGGVLRPLYFCQAGEMSFVCKPDQDIAMGDTDTVSLYHGTTPSDSTFDLEAKALGAAVTEDLWCVCARLRGGQIYVSPWECA